MTLTNESAGSSAGERLFNLDLPALKQTSSVFPEQPDLITSRRLLDVACGTGEWALAAAQAAPHLQITGIDRSDLIDSARTRARASHLDNVTFTVMDPLHPSDLPDAFFDIVNARFLVGFTPLAAWPEVIGTCLRFLRPGGLIRLVEADELITTSPACEKLQDLLARALWQVHHHLFPPTQFEGQNLGQNLLITPLLPRVLRNAGLTQVQQAAYVTDFSAGTEAHSSMVDEITRTYHRLLPWFVRMGLSSGEELEQVYQQMLFELRAEDFGGVGFYLTVWGRKNEAEENAHQ